MKIKSNPVQRTKNRFGITYILIAMFLTIASISLSQAALPTPPVDTWSVVYGGTIIQINYGNGTNFPQYAALDTNSSYLRLVAPDTNWGTSIVLLPSFWENGTNGTPTLFQGAPVSNQSYINNSDMVFLLNGTISNLTANITLRISPPLKDTDTITANVSVSVSGNVTLASNRPGEAFRPVMLSSMHINSSVWDASSAFVDSKEFPIPENVTGWVIPPPPIISNDFGLNGGSSTQKTNAPTVEIILSNGYEITGWVNMTNNPNDDNVGYWAASNETVHTWDYEIKVSKPTPTPTATPTPSPTVTYAATPTPTPSLQPTTVSSGGGGTSNGGTSSSSGGGGGGGGSSGEAFSNIESREKHDNDIKMNAAAVYNFASDKDKPIQSVSITSNINADTTTVTVEVLKGKSSLLKENESAPGTVYKYVNIWTDEKKFTDPKNIKEAMIKFQVERSWFDDNHFASSDIRMTHWNGTGWEMLETKVVTIDGFRVYFEAKTSGFSPFAIIGEPKPAATDQNQAQETPQETTMETVLPTPQPTMTTVNQAPGLSAKIGSLVILAAAILVLYGRIRNL